MTTAAQTITKRRIRPVRLPYPDLPGAGAPDLQFWQAVVARDHAELNELQTLYQECFARPTNNPARSMALFRSIEALKKEIAEDEKCMVDAEQAQKQGGAQ